MMNALIALGLGIIVFALIVATGLVVMAQFSSAVASCPTGFTWNTTNSNSLCCNQTAIELGGACSGASNSSSPSTATTSMGTMMGYMQSNLITWIPAIIALGVGLLFIGALMGRKNKY
jgi:hypothetical protein